MATYSFTDNGHFLQLDYGTVTRQMKKEYISLSSSGDLVYLRYHDRENKDGRYNMAIDWNDITSPTVTSAIDAETQLQAMLVMGGGAPTYTAANFGTFGASLGNATPNDSDYVMTVETTTAKKITWTNVKAFLKTYFDTIYTTTAAVATQITTALSGYLTSTAASSTYLPISSPTATGTLTSPAIIVSSETASRVAIIDGSKNIKSADTSTYPSLTELSYVKGVTSSIQTQLDAKQSLNLFSKSASDQTTTSTSLVNITNVALSIAANENMYIKVLVKVGCSATNGTRFAVTLPSGATMFLSHAGTSEATRALAAPQWLTTSGTEGATTNAVISTNMWMVMEGWVYNGANAGTIQVQGRSINAANTVTFYAGSMITGVTI